MTSAEHYKVHTEPFYQAQGREIALFEAAYAARLPVMVKGPTGSGKSRFVEGGADLFVTPAKAGVQFVDSSGFRLSPE